MRVAIVGCGFVADYYMLTMPSHPELKLVGAFDREPSQLQRFSSYHGVKTYPTLQDLLGDSEVEMVLNLTNPTSHYEVTREALLANKHVYSEKPLALDVDAARYLVKLAETRNLRLSCAPSRVLGETAQTMWQAIRKGLIGKPLLAYAEMDNGLLHKKNFYDFVGADTSGAKWPYKDEFKTGCTIEHAGYPISWLCAFFGPVHLVSSFATWAAPDKKISGLAPHEIGPDFSIACLMFVSGVVARLTCSIVAPRDHSIRIFGDEGTISVNDCWVPVSPVTVTPLKKPKSKEEKLFVIPPLADPSLPEQSRALKKVDFCLGLTELARAHEEKRPSRLSADFSCHVTEVVLAIHDSGTRLMQTSFAPMEPMPWSILETEKSRPDDLSCR